MKLLLSMLLVMLKWVVLVFIEDGIIWVVNRLVCMVFGWLMRNMWVCVGCVIFIGVLICGVVLLVF